MSTNAWTTISAAVTSVSIWKAVPSVAARPAINYGRTKSPAKVRRSPKGVSISSRQAKFENHKSEFAAI